VKSRRRSGLVSIVVTSWNRKKYIHACLKGLAKQTYKNIEVIIVDDGSVDGTPGLIQRWKSSLPSQLKSRVCILTLPRNTGYSGALTTAMFMARGEFIATHDSDDFSHRDRIRRQVLYLRSHPKIGLVGTNYKVIRNGKVYDPKPQWLVFGAHNVRRSYARGAHCITCGSLLFRGSIFDRLGGLNRHMDGAEDYEFVARFSSHGVKMDNLHDVLYYVRQHATQRSRRFYR
jgi:glycosyltransferase involved in cell wall biosynthesis